MILASGGVLFWIGAAVGLLALLAGGYVICQAASSSSWPSVRGEITFSTGVVGYTNRADPGLEPHRTYDAVVRYNYTVDGKAYQSRRVAIGRFGVNHLEFPQGTKVPVYYHPNRPELAVLVPGVHWPSMLLVLFAIGCLVGIPYYLSQFM